MASIEREVELGLINAVSGVSGLNYYTSEKDTARELPFVAVKASIASEELGPFSGVFKIDATLMYKQKADSSTNSGFDLKFQEIVNQFYLIPNLANYITSNTNITIYDAKIQNVNNVILSTNRTWGKNMTFNIMASAKK